MKVNIKTLEANDERQTRPILNLPTKSVASLVHMHSYCRPHNSDTELEFIGQFLIPLGVKNDLFNNYYIVVGEEKPVTLWSAHTDTVHTKDGRQFLSLKDGNATMAVNRHRSPQSSCLGADNTAGVWLLSEMIQAGIPGLYYFFRGEEVGCLGSKWVARNLGDTVLKDIKHAIAFDRKGTTSIITHQRSRRTASDAFARSLADALGMQHKPDPGGIYTDTAEFADIIPECTNVSIGFEKAHSSAETLDVAYALKLRDAVLAADFSRLIASRDPKQSDDPIVTGRRQIGFGWYGDDDASYRRGKKRRNKNRNKAVVVTDHGLNGIERISTNGGDLVSRRTELEILVKNYPSETADLMEAYGITSAELFDHICNLYDGL